jgi:LacI family transcriptional regulator
MDADEREHRATIVDVARAAGVSAATASRVVNGSPQVRGDLARRVHAAVAALTYVPNEDARARRRGNLRTIGFLAEDLSDPWSAGIYSAVRAELMSDRFALVGMEAPERLPATTASLEPFLLARPEAMVVSSEAAIDAAAIDDLDRRALPTVMYGRTTRPDVAAAEIDFAGGMRTLVDHLIGLGHRDVALLSGPRRRAADHAQSDGFTAAVDDAGLPARLVEAPAWTVEAAFGAVGELLAGDEPPSAIAALDPRVAAGAIAAARANGLTVPVDLSVVCFYDAPELGTGELTCIADARGAVAATVAAILREGVAGSVLVPLALRDGQSSARPRRRVVSSR